MSTILKLNSNLFINTNHIISIEILHDKVKSDKCHLTMSNGNNYIFYFGDTEYYELLRFLER